MQSRLGERLVAAGLATPVAVEQALQHQKISGLRLGDCLVELGAVPEAALLRFLAEEFQTRYVTAEKLAQVKIPHEVLDRVPVRLAEAQVILPLAYEPEDRLLSVVAAEPQNKTALSELALVTGAEEVVAFIGLRRSIQAGIRKHYYRDPAAFESREAVAAAREREEATHPAAPQEPRATSVITGIRDRDPRLATGSTQMSNRFNLAREAGARGVSEEDYTSTVAVLISLMERRGSRAGHSAAVARSAALVARHLGLTPREVVWTQLTAQLHDLGHDRHLTLTQVGTDDAQKADARRLARRPIHLLGDKGLPPPAAAALSTLFERFDGTGAQGLEADEIPIAARIVAATDAAIWALRHEGRAKDDVLSDLSAASGTLYDPGVIECLVPVLRGDVTRRMLGQSGRALVVVDPDPVALRASVGALERRGLLGVPLSNLDGLADVLIKRAFDVLLISAGCGVTDCLSALQLARSQPETAGLPVVVYGALDKSARDRLRSADVTALVESTDADAIAEGGRSQLENLVTTGGAGRVVEAGSEHLPLAEVIATLNGASANGRVQVRGESGKTRAEGTLHFERGRLVHAALGEQKGRAALTALLALNPVDYTFDPDALLIDVPGDDLSSAA